jgi:hypothetical protein
VQLELVDMAAVGAPLVGCVLAADCFGADWRAPAPAAVGVAGVGVADGAVDLEEAADEGLEEGRAGCDDADVELEAVRVKRQYWVASFSFIGVDLLFPDMDP